MSRSEGKIVAVCTSVSKGTVKKDVGCGVLVADLGVEGDAHAGFAHRQVSLIAMEDVETMREKLPDLVPGSFAENLTTEGIDLAGLSIGDRLKVGEATLEVSQIGKECHSKCEVFRISGECIMPRKGIFCRVLEGGTVRTGDTIARCSQ